MNRKIFRLALPNIFSNITIPLLGLVDTALMGHLDKVEYLGAIALGSMVFNIVYWSLGFLRMGTVGFTAQAYGAQNRSEQNLIFNRAALIAISLGLLIIAFHPLIIHSAIYGSDSSEMVKTFADEYVRIRIWAAPASLLLLVFSGWFIGMQNAVYPMYIAIVGNILNIIFSFVFVYFFDMKIAGAALGTVIAQYASLMFAFHLLLKKYNTVIGAIKLNKIFKINEMKQFFVVNRDIFIRTLGIIFVISFFTFKSAGISDYILAVNTILFQFFLIYTFMLDGFANAAEALTGEYIGSNDLSNLRKSIRKNMMFGLIFSALFSVVYAFFGENLMRLLTDNQQIIAEAKPLFIWIILLPLIAFPAFIYDGIFIGATASAALRNGMIMSVLLAFVPIYYLTDLADSQRLWLAFLAFLAARGITLKFYLKKNVLGKIV